MAVRFIISSLPDAPSVAHRTEQLVIVVGALHAILDKLHSLHRIAVGKEAAENPHAVEGLTTQQQIVAPC